MTTDTKSTMEYAVRLQEQHDVIYTMVSAMITYHNKRTSFFKAWDFTFSVINAFVGVGALFLIGWQLADKTDSMDSAKISLWVAASTVLLLFLSKLFDFSKKQENHRWLGTIYRGYNKELSYRNLTHWNNLTAEECKEWKDLHDRMKEGMDSLKKLEYPLLEFELFLCGLKVKLTEETQGTLFLEVNGWYRFCAGYFSMENTKAILIAKHHDQERQKARQEQQKK